LRAGPEVNALIAVVRSWILVVFDGKVDVDDDAADGIDHLLEAAEVDARVELNRHAEIGADGLNGQIGTADISRGNEISAADFETGSMLASIIVSERVPSIGSSSRLSMPSSRMLTRSLPCQSGRTFFTTETMPCATWAAGLTGAACGAGALTVTGSVTLTGPAANRTAGGGAPGCRGAESKRAASTRQLPTKIAPKARPPRTNAQKTTIVNSGGPARPLLIAM
jgi:hypothetical protein